MPLFRHSYCASVIRTPILVPFFLAGVLCTRATQVVGLFILTDPGQRQALVNVTKTHFITLLVFVTSVINPCKISIEADELIPSQDSFRVSNGHLVLSLTPNSVFIGNHQIYTDWMFLWFLSYTSRLSDSVFIIMKDMSKIPVLGPGMQVFKFMFLSRKWELDKVKLTNQLNSIDANARGMGPANGVVHVELQNVADHEVSVWPAGRRDAHVWPYHIIIYPEGTVTSPHTRIRSDKYCDKLGLPHFRHVLLPRVRGLFLTLRKLRGSVEVVYDFTTGYLGLKAGENGEDIFTLKAFYLLGYGPRRINYHVRAFRLDDIPLGRETADIDDVADEDLKRFEKWLYDLWVEKDELMDHFYRHGSFGGNPVVADFKLRSPLEVAKIFVPFVLLLVLLRLAYVLARLLV